MASWSSTTTSPLKKGAVRDSKGRWLPETGALLKELSADELQRYDVGRLEPASRYAARFPEQQPRDGARIPKLGEVIELIQSSPRSDTALWIELKTSPLDPAEASPPERLAEAVVAELARARFQGPALAPELQTVFTTYPRVWLSEDDTASLGIGARLRRLAPGVLGWRFFLRAPPPRDPSLAALAWRVRRG